jgi:hypothetical protein
MGGNGVSVWHEHLEWFNIRAWVVRMVFNTGFGVMRDW